MFTVRKRHNSLSSFTQNPQTNTKMKKKTSQLQNIQQKLSSINMLQSQRSSRMMLPKLNTSQRPRESKAMADSNSMQVIDTKKQQPAQMKQLSIRINKYYTRRVQYTKRPFNELAYDILSIMQCLSKLEGSFQQMLQFLYQDMRQFMLVSEVEAGQWGKKYEISQGQVYKKGMEKMDKTVGKRMKQMKQKLKQMKDSKQQIQLQYSRSRQNWQRQFVKQQLELQSYKKLNNKQHIKQLQEKYKQAQQRIEQLQLSEKQLVMLRDHHEKQLQLQQHSILENVKEIKLLKTKLEEMTHANAESQRLFIMLRDRFDQITLRINDMKALIDAVQNQNEIFKTQRIQLLKRAALNFQQLTPRPNYQKLFTFTPNQETLKLKSTQEITKFIVSQLKHPLTQQQKHQNLFDLKFTQNQKQLHPKLQQVVKFRQSTIQAIKQSKQQMKKVRNLLLKSNFPN